jgi:hypothetical protein
MGRKRSKASRPSTCPGQERQRPGLSLENLVTMYWPMVSSADRPTEAASTIGPRQGPNRRITHTTQTKPSFLLLKRNLGLSHFVCTTLSTSKLQFDPTHSQTKLPSTEKTNKPLLLFLTKKKNTDEARILRYVFSFCYSLYAMVYVSWAPCNALLPGSCHCTV